MSEFFGRSDKQEQLKQIVLALHAGKSVPELKEEFSEILKGLSAEEIAMMEQSLIDEGFGVESIMSLCDVHVEVFEDELKKQKDEHMLPGHPIYTYREENRELERRLKQFESAVKNIKKDEKAREEALTLLDDIKQIEKHYQRKENQLFAKLEEVGFTGPTSVMWGKHDEVRDAMKACREALNTEADPKVIKKAGSAMIKGMKNMIFMEEKILFPTSIKKLDPITWPTSTPKNLRSDSPGYDRGAPGIPGSRSDGRYEERFQPRHRAYWILMNRRSPLMRELLPTGS